jgi:hypothetical protein
MQKPVVEVKERERIRQKMHCPYCEAEVFDRLDHAYLGGQIQESTCRRCHTIIRKHFDCSAEKNKSGTFTRLESGDRLIVN